jgi:DNA-binding MarR family transcriptional regulator
MPRVELLTKVSAEPEVAPDRSVRRAAARRASHRRATARDHQSDTRADIIGFLIRHPESTVGDTAKGLGLSPASVSAHLTQLVNVGEVKKATHGYTARRPAQTQSS